MRALSNFELLDVWEAGIGQTATERALSLVAAAEPEIPVEELARLSVGRRDLRLFLLRKAMFGGALPLTAVCPSCSERVEADVDIDALLLDEPAVQEGSVDAGGYAVRFRLPDSFDVTAVENEPTAESAAARLLASCIVAAERHGEAVDAPALPEAVVVAVAQRMAELDPQAEIELTLTCPACGTVWNAPLDIVSFFWSEIQAWARRTTQDVHVLASAYSWSEGEILRMSGRRRQAYLDMIGG